MSTPANPKPFIVDRSGFEEAMGAMIIQSSPLSSQYLFYANMIVQCAVEFKQMQAPASVHFKLDHYVLSIDPDKFNPWPLEHRCGVLKHEMLHILNGHLIRFEDRENFQKWNYATDCAINQLIDSSHLPSGCINPSNLPVKPSTKVPLKVNSEQYYDLIDDDQLPPDDQQGKGMVGDHSEWNNSEGTNETLQKDIAKSMLEKAANETQKSRGTLPGEFSDWLAINSASKQVSWQRVLRNLAGNKRVNTRQTIMRSNRRLQNREDLKGKLKNRIFDIAVVSDVSGSVSTPELIQLWAELKNICTLTNSGVKLVQVDTQPYPPEELKKSTSVMNRKASGGTNLSPALDMLKKHKVPYDALVITTDGGLCPSDVNNFINAAKRVIWLVSSEGTIMSQMQENGMQAYKLDAIK